MSSKFYESIQDLELGEDVKWGDRKQWLTVVEKDDMTVTVEGPRGGRYSMFDCRGASGYDYSIVSENSSNWENVRSIERKDGEDLYFGDRIAYSY